MKQKLVTVARFTDYLEADLVRQVLEDEGITAFVMGQNVGNVYGGVPGIIDIELQTPEGEAEQARAILEARDQGGQPGEDSAEDENPDLDDDKEQE